MYLQVQSSLILPCLFLLQNILDTPTSLGLTAGTPPSSSKANSWKTRRESLQPLHKRGAGVR